MDTNAVKQMFLDMPDMTKFEAINKLNGKKIRCLKEDNDAIFEYAPNKKRYGWRRNMDYAASYFEPVIKSETDKERKWHKQINRAIKALDGSGLWPDLKVYFENLNKMTLEDKKQMEEMYWFDEPGATHAEREKAKTQRYKNSGFVDKYPFAFYKSDDGETFIDTNYIFEKSGCRLKSMYFGKYTNKDEKLEIKAALNDHRSYSTNAYTSYDVSFEYNADKNMAWYSEEYKGCGNGHYYLALDENTALFCEDD